MTSVLCICRKAFEFVYRMEPADDEESKRPLFQSWVGKLRELPENAKISSVRFPEVGSTTFAFPSATIPLLLIRPERLTKYRWSIVPACAVIEACVSQGPTCSCEVDAVAAHACREM